jgi:hypothetical protein
VICCEHLIVLLYPAMITRDLSLPALNTSRAKVKNKAKLENKAKVENKAKMENKAKVENKTPVKTTTIKVERDGMPIHRYDVKVKVEEHNKVKVYSPEQKPTWPTYRQGRNNRSWGNTK